MRRAVGEEAGVIVQVAKGQQGPAVVLEAGVDGQQPQLVGLVAEPQGEGVLAAVHHAGVHEGGERVDLVADGDVAPFAGRAGAEEGDAVTLVLDAGVVRRDLRHRERPGGLAEGRDRDQEWLSPVHLPEGLNSHLRSSLEPRTRGGNPDTKTELLGPLGRQEGVSRPPGDQPEVPPAERLRAGGVSSRMLAWGMWGSLEGVWPIL